MFRLLVGVASAAIFFYLATEATSTPIISTLQRLAHVERNCPMGETPIPSGIFAALGIHAILTCAIAWVVAC
jgi:hypothetical protein